MSNPSFLLQFDVHELAACHHRYLNEGHNPRVIVEMCMLYIFHFQNNETYLEMSRIKRGRVRVGSHRGRGTTDHRSLWPTSASGDDI